MLNSAASFDDAAASFTGTNAAPARHREGAQRRGKARLNAAEDTDDEQNPPAQDEDPPEEDETPPIDTPAGNPPVASLAAVLGPPATLGLADGNSLNVMKHCKSAKRGGKARSRSRNGSDGPPKKAARPKKGWTCYTRFFVAKLADGGVKLNRVSGRSFFINTFTASCCFKLLPFERFSAILV